MIQSAVVPATIVHLSVVSQPIVYAKSLTNPCMVACVPDAGAVSEPQSWSLVALYPSPGSAPGMK